MALLIDIELTSMRSAATAALHDECVITRATEPVFDPIDGTYTPGTVTAWSGPVQVRPMMQERQTAIGDIDTILDKYIATLPFDADGFAVNDVLTVTAATDPGLVGRSFRIYALRWSSPQINRRVVLEVQQHTEAAES
jgi:hypothetical protein